MTECGMRKRRPPVRHKGKSNRRLPLAPGLELVGVGKRADGSYSAALHAKTLDGSATVIIPFEWLTTPLMIEKALVRIGYVSTDVKRATGPLVKTLLADKKLPSIAFADRIGWKDEYRAYAFGREAIGEPSKHLVFPPTSDEAEEQGQLTMGRAAGGSWRAWRDAMAGAFRSSDVILGAVCLGLASTMASRMGVESGLVHFFGPSTGGKTLTLACVWSLFGPCNRDRIPNWNATPTGFEEVLDVVADAPFVCDELTFLEADSDAAKNFKNTAYAIASNRGRVRSKHWTGGATSPVRPGRTFVLSTGELSLEELTAKHSGARRLGERCRALDINVDFENGTGVFDSLPNSHDLASFAKMIESQCQVNHGHAGYHFIQHLIDTREDWPARAARAMDEFRTKARVPSAGYARRYGERFAVSYASGLEGRRSGILTVSKKEVFRAILRLYRRGAKTLPNPERDAKRALKALKLQLVEGTSVVRLRPGKKVPRSDLADGQLFRRKDPKHGVLYLIKPEALAKLCGSQGARGEAIRLLRAGSYLIADSRGLATKQVSVAGAKRKSRFVCVKQSFVDDAKDKVFASEERYGRTRPKTNRARSVIVYV
jgi:hypothetical protein